MQASKSTVASVQGPHLEGLDRATDISCCSPCSTRLKHVQALGKSARSIPACSTCVSHHQGMDGDQGGDVGNTNRRK